MQMILQTLISLKVFYLSGLLDHEFYLWEYFDFGFNYPCEFIYILFGGFITLYLKRPGTLGS